MSGGGRELAWLTITEARRLIAQRQVSPVDLVQAVLAQIDRLEPKLNCFITRQDEQALAAARVAEAAIATGDEVGPLHGIPIAVKDNIETAGIRSTAGSIILGDYVPPEDAPAWERLKAAGAILVGKTNLHEFGVGTTNINPHYGTSCNPWNPDYVVGGSSGGSAAAVAAGMALGALGTDAGGSVRIPAAFCGAVGLKQTHGRVPVRGLIGSGNPTVDHIGPITRSVADAALLLSIMAGYDPRDPTTCAVSGPPEAPPHSTDLRGLRLGVPRDHYFESNHPEVERAVRAAITELGELGAEVREVRLPDHGVLVDGAAVVRAEALAYHERWLRTRLSDYGEDVQARLLAAQFLLASDYAKGVRARRLLLVRYAAVWQEVDLLVAPTVVVPVPSIAAARAGAIMLNGQAYDAAILSRNTRPGNLTGLPGISVPCGLADGLPVGLMLLGRPFDEPTLYRAAAAYEHTTTWHHQRPPAAA